MKFLLVLAVCLAAVSADSQTVRYDGHEVLRAYPKSREQVEALMQLEEDFDFWTEARLNGPTDIRAGGFQKVALRSFLRANNIEFEVFINDLQKRVYWQSKGMARDSGVNAIDWVSYHSTATIQQFIEDISKANPDISEIINIGTSTEGRPLKLIRIGANGGTRKKAYFMDGGIHAREWISPAVCTYFINELLTNRDKYQDLLAQVDFYIIPVLNVDGYEYTRSSARMWRKTRSRTTNANCPGVDPNRNYDVEFGGPGTSSNPCSEIYKGERAFSEPETRAMRDFIVARGRTTADWKIYNGIHSYSQLILTPWGYTYDFPADYQAMKSLGLKAAAALKAVHGTSYVVGSVTEVLSPGSGGSDDWAYGSGNFAYSYTIELRDRGNYGFLLPPNQIRPCAEETWQAVLVMANTLLS